MENEISIIVMRVAAEQGGVSPDQVSPATHFVNDLNFDSLDVVEFAMKIEDELHVAIPNETLPELHIVKDVIDYVTPRVPTNAEAGAAGQST